jgi:thioredoxin 1
MNVAQFEKTVKTNKHPLVIDLWAPWCGPCKAMNPLLEQVKSAYTGKVDVMKINSDESQALLSKLNVVGIPTLLAYVDGKQVYRKTGMHTSAALNDLFKQLSEGKQELQVSTLTPVSRIFRVLLGVGCSLPGIILLSPGYSMRQVLWWCLAPFMIAAQFTKP